MVLCFLSRGYLRSTNCLREIRAALEMGKPLVLVHEADPDKGGGTLAELRSECPEELQAAIFEAGWPMAVWHRIEAFQHVSLKVIAEALLLKIRVCSILFNAPFAPAFPPVAIAHLSPICCPRGRRWRTAARLARRQCRRMARLVGCVHLQPGCALALMPRRRRSRTPS